MGAGRNLQMTSNTAWARNLTKNQLGGVIFGCTKITMTECLANQLFGLPAQHILYVKNIEPGLPLFLFNYSDRKLYGIFEAASSGKLNIDSYAWTTDGSERTKYPAQVQVLVRMQCQALSENQFRPIIADNYYSPSHFWFELDHTQASKLTSMLSSLAISPRPITSQIPPKCVRVHRLSSNNKREESGVSEPPTLTDYFDSIGTSAAPNDSICLDGNNKLSAEASRVKSDEKDVIYKKLKELALNHEFEENIIGSVENETHDHDDMVGSGEASNASSFDSLNYPTTVAQLHEELKTFKQEQTQKMESLEKKLILAEREIQRLENRCTMLESICNFSTRSGDENLIESSLYSNIHESILIVGGYDGVTWSSALDSFSPTNDVLRSLKPMSSVRSFASVVNFNGELYVLGGGTSLPWYNTVESYNAVSNEWRTHPSLNKEKGSLAGAALNGKIYAVGGGNGVNCFADVEMFDPHVGKWICARSMLEKRFALGAVELNGALYAVGGYDGNKYLKSAERFDPREHSWTRIGSMSADKGCHSLVALNEKLYAIGGYDGTAMVRSVEIFEPRVGTWMPGEPMNECRGYHAAAVYDESIFVIGGAKSNDDDIEDKIECYKEGEGWQVTKLRAVGKRCFASAIVLERD